MVHGLTKHGMSKTREYTSWQFAKQRCYNPRSPTYYGGKIIMCLDWFNSFEAFYAHMGPCPKGMTLDRWPDPHGNYEPGNCRWATPKEQANNRRNTVYAIINGDRRPLMDWCRLFEMTPNDVNNLIYGKKFTPEQALKYVGREMYR